MTSSYPRRTSIVTTGFLSHSATQNHGDSKIYLCQAVDPGVELANTRVDTGIVSLSASIAPRNDAREGTRAVNNGTTAISAAGVLST